jgi:hypothetical protein
MPTAVEILQVVARVRHNGPRNQDVVFICDCLERLIVNIESLTLRRTAELRESAAQTERAEQKKRTEIRERPRFNKRVYQREYMRRRRARKRSEGK